MNRLRLLHFVLCFFQLSFLSAMINPSETATSTDTIQNVSDDSTALIYVVKGTVVTSDLENITSAKIIEIEKVSTEAIVVKENNNDTEIEVKEKATPQKLKIKTTPSRPNLAKKTIWLPITTTCLTNTEGLIHRGTLPVVNYSKVVLTTTKFVKLPHVISYKVAITKIERKEILILEDYSQSTRVRPPPYTA